MNYLNINNSQGKVLNQAAFCFPASYKRMYQRQEKAIINLWHFIDLAQIKMIPVRRR